MPARIANILTPKFPQMIFGLPWRIIDSARKLRFTRDGVQCWGGATVGFADPRLEDTALRLRVPGRTYQLIMRESNTASQRLNVGWALAATTTTSPDRYYLYPNSAVWFVIDTGNQFGGLESMANDTDYTVTLVQTQTGFLALLQGGVFSSQTLLWVAGGDFTSSLYRFGIGFDLGSATVNQPMEARALAQTDYGGVWGKHYPGVDSVAYHPANGATATMAANGAVEVIWKGANETLDISVRHTDDNNRWAIQFVQSTSTLSIVEVNSGTPTTRASGATGSGSVVVGEWCRIFIRCNGNRIDVGIKSTAGAPNKFLSYTSASFNNTATGVKLVGGTTFYTLAVWPVVLSGPSSVGAKALSIFASGDSRTAASGDATAAPVQVGYPYWLWRGIESAQAFGANEQHAGHSGFTTAQLQAVIDADLAAIVGTPDVIILNIGVNDLSSPPSSATWQANYAYILDAMHARYPAARILVSKVWGIGFDSAAATIAGWIDTVLSTRSWASVGCDESVTLKGGDNGATNMSDTLHPNATGHQALAAAYQSALGY